MAQPSALPRCPKCNGPTIARHVSTQDGVRHAWAECPDCGERAGISADVWLDNYRPQRPADIDAAHLTPERLASLGLLSC